MIIKKVIISLLLAFLVKDALANNEINISPIVQVISYTDIYWKYPQMMWWWSASIINDNWIIISNDHVVDDGKWALASAFSVCITKEISKKPICDYTASLIARDDKLDISILKIDPKDIYWNDVDYKKFKTIWVDFDYTPKNQDETIAIGYPWVWADTISETKWIVSWVSEYNWYKYIKTDTLIAWWNSGWAFIKDWKLIWIPTFWIWGWWDNSMWYALSIKEAKNFIEENISKPSNKASITSLIDFNSYRKNIEDINNSLKLKDDVFDLDLPDDYKIQNYIKNNSISIELRKQKDTWVNSFVVYLEKTPEIKNDKQLFYYYETKWLYNKSWQKLIKKNINWKNFYYAVDKTDLSNGTSSWWNNYFTIENWYLITISIQAPFYDEKRNKDVKIEVEKLLNSLKIYSNNFFKIQNNFSTNIPKIDIPSLQKAIIDTWKYKVYLWNLYENFEIYLNELIEYNGKWKTVKEIYSVQLKDIDNSLKSMIKFWNYDWFIYCGSQNYSNYYNYYNYYGWVSNSTDENWNAITLENCEINIYFPLNKELNRQNYLSLRLTSLKNNKEKNLDIAIRFLKKYLKIENDNSEIDVPNILKNQVKLNFKDIWNQTKDYKNFLKLLLRYKIINDNEKFDWNRIISWWEYLDMYVKNVYKYDLSISKCDKKNYKCRFIDYKVWERSLDEVFKSIWINNYNDIVDYSKLYDFDTILNYALAGVDIWKMSLEDYFNFKNLIDDEINEDEKNKINNFNNSIFWNKKIYLSDFYSNYNTTYFTSKTPRYYVDSKKTIYLNEVFQSDKLDFSNKTTLLWNELLKLSNKVYIIPLTYAQALEKISAQIDFSLFDEKLKEKKDTNIEWNLVNN